MFIPLYGVINVINNPVFSKEQYKIVQTVMSPAGYIDKSLYDQFWSDFKDPTIKKQIDSMGLLKILSITQKIQYENFKSARMSIQQKRLVKTKKLLELYKEAENFGMDLTIPKQNTDLLLKAAANREAVNNNGVLTYITEDFIDQVMINLDSSIERVGMLLSQEWKETQKERNISKAKILWAQPFYFEKKEEYLNGIAVKSSSYMSMINKDTFLMISEINTPNSDTNLCVNNFAESFRENPLTEKRTLQKHVATTGFFVSKVDATNVSFNIMCVKANENMYVISAGSSTPENSLFYFDKAIHSLMLP